MLNPNRKKTWLLLTALSTIAVGAVMAYGPYDERASAQVSGSWQPPQGSPLSNKEHPRLFFTADSKQKIIDKIKTYYQTDFRDFVNTLDADYGTSFSGYETQNLGINAVRNYALLCQIEPSSVGVSGSYSRQEYCDESVRLAKQMASALPDYRDSIHCAQTWDGKNCGLFNVSLAVAYDWAYNDMSVADRQSLQGYIESSFDRCNEDCKGERPLIMNVATTAAFHGVFPFLALYGDGSSREAEMTDWYKKNFLDGMLAVSDSLYEGSAYHNEGDSYSLDVVLPIVMMSSASSPALNTNLFEKHAYLRYMPDYFYYTTIPQKTPYGSGGYAGERNNTHRYGVQWMPDETPYIVLNASAAELDDVDSAQAGFAKWLSDGPGPYALGGIENVKRYDRRLYDLFTKFIWGTRQVQVLDADSANKNLMQNLGGQIVMRSSHDSESATRAVFHAYDWFYASSHDDTEQGAIGIWKYGPLILDSVGNSKNSSNMRRWTTNKGPALNSLMGVFKPGETDKDGYNFMEFDITWPGASTINDPSQYYEGSQMDRGDKVMDRKVDLYDYVNYDYGKMYTDKASSARRQYVYLRGPENKEYVVVYDQVDSAYEKRALFHSGVDWQAIGGSWGTEGVFDRLIGTRTVKIDNSSLPSGKGALFLKVLTQNANIYKQGGQAYPLTDVEGRNISYGGSGDYEYECFSIGCWRIQVRTNESNLLTAMQIGASQTIGPNMVSTVAVDGGNSEGVMIGDRVVMFSRTSGQQMSSTGYTVSTSEPVTHIIANMTPDTEFEVVINGASQNIISSSAGVLTFRDDGTGNRSVSIGGGVSVPQDTEPPRVTVFAVNPEAPQETSNTVEISWTASDNKSLDRIEIWRADFNGTDCSDSDKSGCSWRKVQSVNAYGSKHSGSATDNPPVGTFWYGIHAIDSSGNIGYEPNPPGSLKVIKIESTDPGNGGNDGGGNGGNGDNGGGNTPSNNPPDAVISASPTAGSAPLVVDFTGTNSSDSDGTIVSYSWDFGDGSGSSIANPTYTYQSPGTFTARLTVTDNQGAIGQSSVIITVTEPASGNVIYVDNRATQAGDGSQASPYQSIAKGIEAIQPGQTMIIVGDASGIGRVYAEDIDLSKNGSATAMYTMKSQDGETVIVQHSNTITPGDYWVVRGIVFDHQNTSSDAIRISGSNTTFDGVTLKNGKRDGFEIDGSARDITIKNSNIYNFVWQPGSDAHCIVIDPGAGGINIDSNTIYDCGGDGVQIFANSGDEPSTYAKNVTISNNTIYTTRGTGSENALDIKGAVGLTIDGNTIYGFENKAIVIQKGPQNVSFTRNTVYDSLQGLEVRGEGGFNPINVDIINNVFYNITGEYALKFDNVENLKAQHNTLVSISGNPFRIELGGVVSGYIQNNLISSSGQNSVSGTQNAIVSHNGWFDGATSGSLGGTNEVAGDDAQFVDASAFDYRLKSNSLAKDSGRTLSHVATDFDGTSRPQGSGYDLGAYEVASSSGNPEVYIDMISDKTEVYVGDSITYTLTYRNNSDYPAVNLRIYNDIPPGTELIPGSITGGGIVNSGTIEWVLSRVEARQFGDLSFSVTVLEETPNNPNDPPPDTTDPDNPNDPNNPPPDTTDPDNPNNPNDPPPDTTDPDNPNDPNNPPPDNGIVGSCVAPGQRGGAVVVSGANIPSSLVGKPIDSVYGYSYKNNEWTAEPIQIDERRPAPSPTIATVYVTPSSLTDTVPENDWAGTDTEPGIDNGQYSDEIVFDYSSLGPRAPGGVPNPEGAKGTRYEVAVTDTLTDTTKYFYLFQTNNSLQRSTVDFVSYDYNVSDCNGYASTCEDTTAQSACYSTHFSLRWVQDEIRIKPEAGGDNTDIIDRVMGAAYATSPDAPFRASVGENEDHKMNAAIACGGWSVYDPIHYYLGHIDGPVRAIRQIKGACSFEDLIRIWKFSGAQVDETLSMQGHSFGVNSGGYGMRTNYSKDAVPLTYYSESFPDGIKFDGEPDFGSAVNISEINEAEHMRGIWSQIDSARGGLVKFSKQITPYADPSVSSYWLYMHDDAQFTDATGDRMGMYGGEGFRLRSFENANERPILYETSYRPTAASIGVSGNQFGNLMRNPLQINVTQQTGL